MEAKTMKPGAVASRALLRMMLISSAILAPTAALAQPRDFDIPPRGLGEALNLFAGQAGVQIFFPGRLVVGRRAPALKGRMEPRLALARLIAGAGLEVAQDDGRIIILRVDGRPSRPVLAKAPPRRSKPEGPQGDAASPLEAVIVTAGLRSADLKRHGDTVGDTVTQLEIQRLPNLDASDVLARLPGVRRNETQSGESRYVQIRGLNNAAASQSIDGVLLSDYVNASHATSTELLPAYFIKTATVTTTVTPDLDENANSAHVAFTTISGLDSQGRHVGDVRVLAGAASRAGELGGALRPLRVVGTWRGALDQNGRIGLAVGANLDRLESRQDAVSVTGFDQSSGQFIPTGALTRGETHTRTERRSAMARLDLRPSSRLSLFGEYFFLRHDFIADQRTATVSIDAGDAIDAMAGGGQIRAGAVSYGFGRSHPKLTDHIVQFGVDYDTPGGDAVRLRLGATRNRVTAQPITLGGGFAAPSGLSSRPLVYAFDHGALSFMPVAAASAGDAADYRLAEKTTIGDALSRDQNAFARADYAHNNSVADEGLGIKVGVQLKTQVRSNLQRGLSVLAPPGGLQLSSVSTATSVALLEPVSWDPAALVDHLALEGRSATDGNSLYARDPADGFGQNFNGSEVIALGYGIASFGWSRGRVSGGLRAAHTHRELDEYDPDAVGRYRLSHYQQTYWHVLPSLYGYYDVTSALKLRAAMTQTLERPAITSAGRRQITSYDAPATRSISYSNPYLKPIRSTNYDASVEYYYGRSAYLSLGAFAKDLREISAASSSQTIAPDGVREVTTYTSNVREVNGKKVFGRVRGIEIAWSDPRLSVLPRALGNLGMTLSYVYLDYRVTALNGGGGVAPTDVRLVPSAPRGFANLNLAYNRGPFAANVAVQKISSLPTFTYDPANDRRTAYGALVDLQGSWQVSRTLRLLVEGRNLLDKGDIDRAGVTGYGPAYQIRRNGRTVWAGFQMTLF
ncbi:TonB-dependent receptor [Caulobacter sp. 1776]|uniref:TonB-dependent receptor n=1 Tax=Caulobacter sp. 1776 TaxID=3156420 RepID=UPI00339A633D